MKPVQRCFLAAAICGACALPAAAQQARGPDVLAEPTFLAVTQEYSPEARLELAAHISMALHQYERAIPMYEALLKTSPNRAGLWAMLASAYNNADDAREAHNAADIAVTLAPHFPHFYLERGIASFRLDRHADAVADLKHYVKAFPLVARAHFYLGLAQAAQGEAEPARVSLLRARALNPSLSVATEYYLGLIAADRGQMGMSRELLTRTQRAFAGSGLPLGELVAAQLQDVNGTVAQRLRAAVHESDVRAARASGPPASR
jgi:tetratricopeptide (TPR) repeat protein